MLLLVPSTLPKHHLRCLVELVVSMGFKQVMPLLESVAASYAMAAQTACVVDLGHTQTTVSCVDDGQVQPQSVIKKRYGGQDISELLYRLIVSPQALHYFPTNVFWPLHYPYHSMLLDRLKTQYSSLQMGVQDEGKHKQELVKAITLVLKEQSQKGIKRPAPTKKHPESTQVMFNCSEALLIAPQALFYSQLFAALPSVTSKHETDPRCLDGAPQDWEDT